MSIDEEVNETDLTDFVDQLNAETEENQHWYVHATGYDREGVAVDYCFLDGYLNFPDLDLKEFSFPEFEPPKRKYETYVTYEIPLMRDLKQVNAYLYNLQGMGLSNRAIARALFPEYSESGIAGQISLIQSEDRPMSKENTQRWISKVGRLLAKEIVRKRQESAAKYRKRYEQHYRTYLMEKQNSIYKWEAEKKKKESLQYVNAKAELDMFMDDIKSFFTDQQGQSAIRYFRWDDPINATAASKVTDRAILSKEKYKYTYDYNKNTRTFSRSYL